EVWDAGLVEMVLEASRQRGPHSLPLGRAAPVARGGDRSRIRRETDEIGMLGVSFPYELADVPLAELAHARRPRVAEVGVVLPDDDPRRIALLVDVVDQRLQRVRHVPVTEVP